MEHDLKQLFDETIHNILDKRLLELEDHFDSDVLFYYGEIYSSLEKEFRNLIEQLKKDSNIRKRLTIILNTPGGSAETVEKLVNVIRFHYEEIYFIVPDYAMSAGTIFCMAGDKIFMDYTSSLGPIDPQIFNGKSWVPALGYLDQVNKLIKKSADGVLTEAEFLILREIDLAELRSFEMARDLTVTLLKDWLVKYKFKNWTKHRSNKKPVTDKEKQDRAEEIAKKLGDNTIWQSHGRTINIDTLKNFLKLEIEDYSNDANRTNLIRQYNDLITEYILRHRFSAFKHTRKYF